MRLNSFSRTTAALAVTIALAACGDATTEPTESGVSAQISTAATNDVAVVAGDAASEDVETFKLNRGAFGLPTLDTERFSRWDPCPFDQATGRFVCSDRTRGPFTNTRSYAYRDAAGAAQSAYSATTTATANFTWSLSGTISRDKWSGSMSRNRDITLSGLLGANNTVTVNGTSSTERLRTRFLNDTSAAPGLAREYSMESTLTIANVVTPAIRLPDAWPASGTITRTYTVTRVDATNTSAVVTRNSVVTFNGTQFVPLVVNGKTFTLDLATGKVTPATA